MSTITSLRWLPMGFALAACSGSSGGGSTGPDSRLLVTTGTNVVTPAAGTGPAIDLTSLGADRVERFYRLTTPANTPLQFELVSWRADASGVAWVSVDHVRDGATAIGNDPLSMVRAGLLPLGNSLVSDGDRVWSSGDGFVRLTIHGQITENQLLAVQTEGNGVAVVEIAIGAASAINRLPGTEPELPSVVSRDTVYSSDSWLFGLPTVAVSGDRTSIVCYEGDRAEPNSDRRYELRLQHDGTTGVVTGGGTAQTPGDSGYWRDHEIVALYNVLGVVRAEETGVRVRLSFDRGATFTQDVQVLAGMTQARLVQAAMAADYSLAVAGWRARDGGGLEFVLVEGRAVAFDTTGSPTWFQFTPAEVLHTVASDAAPLTTGIAWSAGGDLVVGYAYNAFIASPMWPWSTRSTFRCATRRFGGAIVDTEVDSEVVFAVDPTVAVLGQGDDLRIFYAYEVRSGIQLATSEDGGASWQLGATFGVRGDYLPTVFARTIGGETRVDVLYIAHRDRGAELHRTSWASWPNGPMVEEALTKAHIEQVPGAGSTVPFSLRVRQIGFAGYDATLDGNQIVAAYDEVENDAELMSLMMFRSGTSTTLGGGIILPPSFSVASPPPLAPGMTLPMPAPNPAHAHQLKVLRLQ